MRRRSPSRPASTGGNGGTLHEFRAVRSGSFPDIAEPTVDRCFPANSDIPSRSR